MTLFEMFLDSDSDGFGDPNASVEDCVLLEGYVENDADCDDSSAAARPGAEEICDGLDNDCDSSTGEEGMVTRLRSMEPEDVSEWFAGTSDAVATVRDR